MSRFRTVVSTALLLFVAVSFAYFGFSDRDEQVQGPRQECADSNDGSCRPDDGSDRRVVAYYFHMTKRCRTCLTIEKVAREAIEAGFAEALLQGWLSFESVNVEEPGNEHFVRDYDVVGSSLILAEVRAGRPVRSQHLTEVWNLVADPQALTAYVQAAVRSFMAGGA